MKIAISSAKTMRDYIPLRNITQPKFLAQAKKIRECILNMSDAELKKMWRASDTIVKTSREAFEAITFEDDLIAALFAYDGMQFTYIKPEDLTPDELSYLESKLYIISALYGPLRIYDGIEKYRLEMVNSIKGLGDGNLYHYWDRMIWDEIKDDVILDLCSKEYGKSFLKYAKKESRVVEVVFVDHFENEGQEDEKMISISVTSKRGRGVLVYQLACNHIERPEQLTFDIPGFTFDPIRTTKDRIVYIRKIDDDWPLY